MRSYAYRSRNMDLEEIKSALKNCEWNAHPIKKSKAWGLHGSSLLNRPTEIEAWQAWYEYCKANNKV